MSLEHPAERGGDGRGRFARLAERASNFTSSPLFFCLCLLLVATVVGVHSLGLPLSWKLLVGESMAAVTLLLLALLKNSERRAEHAIQRKLDAIAAALLEMERGESGPALRDLRKAIGIEEET
ncbi:low affinity iron permease family protein [Streptomyces sp. RerS4]|uniref:low affinity iron permease family protein n=1 Tax=Streptomyces sp. RerS4 TaxID=2942449 RepID=UPI00201BFE44|nr:low affinity iron permease family protein [Streptomyces sp. RerS4]UQX04244.1 low affinity iron permease family protein [Streptomyces sp. RerS4]